MELTLNSLNLVRTWFKGWGVLLGGNCFQGWLSMITQAILAIYVKYILLQVA